MSQKIKLIIVEGLPGCGKSTTANLIASLLSKTGEKVICVDEGVPNHPADYDDYNFPDFENEREKIIKKWKDFVNNAERNVTYIFNCVFLQNPMCETMMRFGMSEDESCKYICEIANIIRPMNPLILYIEQSDEKKTIEKVMKERGIDWLNAVIDYHVNQGYGQRKGLSGCDGYIQCLEERQIREMRILKATGLNAIYLSKKITENEFKELYKAANGNCPTVEQINAAFLNTTKTFALRKDEKPIAMIILLGDYDIHWLVKEFIVHPNYQHKNIEALLYLFAEKYIKSTMNSGSKVIVDLRSSVETQNSYKSLDFIKNLE